MHVCFWTCVCVCVSWSVVLFSLLRAECCISHAGPQMSHIYHVLTQSQPETEWGTQASSKVVQSMCSYVWQKHKQTHTLLSAQAWSNPFIVRGWYALPSRVSLSLSFSGFVECVSPAVLLGLEPRVNGPLASLRLNIKVQPALQFSIIQHSTLC